jgi:hypothetical protein
MSDKQDQEHHQPVVKLLKRRKRHQYDEDSFAPSTSTSVVYDTRKEYRKAAAETETMFLERVLAWNINVQMKLQSQPLSDAVLDELALSRKGIVQFDSPGQYVEFFESLMFEDLKAKVEGEMQAAIPARIISIQAIASNNKAEYDDSDGYDVARFKLKL